MSHRTVIQLQEGSDEELVSWEEYGLIRSSAIIVGDFYRRTSIGEALTTDVFLDPARCFVLFYTIHGCIWGFFFPHSNLCKWFLFIKQIKAITTLQLDTAKVEKDHGDSTEGTSWLPCKIKFWLEFIIKMKSHTLGICDSWWNLDFSWKFCKQIFLHNFDSTIIFLNHSPEGKKPP